MLRVVDMKSFVIAFLQWKIPLTWKTKCTQKCRKTEQKEPDQTDTSNTNDAHQHSSDGEESTATDQSLLISAPRKTKGLDDVPEFPEMAPTVSLKSHESNDDGDNDVDDNDNDEEGDHVSDDQEYGNINGVQVSIPVLVKELPSAVREQKAKDGFAAEFKVNYVSPC